MVKHRLLGLLLPLLVSTVSAQAGQVDRSLRPVPRPAPQDTVATRALTVLAPVGIAPATSLRPAPRPAVFVPTQAKADPEMAAWIAGFRPRALRAGIRPATFDRAFAGVTLDPDVIRRDRNQSEFTKTLWEYLDSAVSDTRVRNGREALRRHGPLLDRIEARYNVEKEVVVAIWGLESAYGNFRGSNSVIRSMATLAYDGRRKRFFEAELLAALEILDQGHTGPANMKGSWAGAMGHTQFMPTSFRALAVDFTGDGRRDIWSDDPADALASTANYLKKSGWTKGQPWGVEVKIPKGFDYRLANRKTKRLPSAWARLGVVGMDGKPVRDSGRASVLLPAGAKGAAFLIFDNFAVIERYNTADAYVIGVGHLSDRIAGGPAIKAKWPRDDRALTFEERKELQRRLTANGYDTRGVDGKVGPLTIDAVRRWQSARGMVPDGYPSLAVLSKLR